MNWGSGKSGVATAACLFHEAITDCAADFRSREVPVQVAREQGKVDPTRPTRSNGAATLAAWLVHLLTASGAVLALLALAAIERESWRAALLLLLAALAIDAVDGSLARLARVKQRLPRIDGATLDLVVDYLNYVFVPVIFIWRAGLVPGPLAPALAAAIVLSSLYVFARSDMKTDDGYFRGFPALWNIVAVYLFAIQPGPGAGAIAVAALVALTFAPVHFVHPFRVRDYGRWPPLLALVWAGSTAPLLWPGWSESARLAWLGCSLGSGALLVGLGLLRSVRGGR
jgi:phosphatidylcholine synthase